MCNDSYMQSVIKDGLQKNEFCCYIRADTGLPPLNAQATTLTFKSVKNQFDAEANINMVKTYIEQAKTAGFSQLRVVQDMRFIDETIRKEYSVYEAQINILCAEYGITCICQYDKTLPADVLFEALKTHPLIFMNNVLCKNFYYVPPELLLKKNTTAVVKTYFENVFTYTKRPDELSEKRYQTLIEHIPDVVYALDNKGHLIEASPAVTALLGYTQKELKGKHFATVVHPDDVEKATHSFVELAKGKKEKTLGLQLRFVTKTGDIRIGEISARAIYDNKTFLRTEGILRDITEREKQKENLEFLAEVVENVMEAVVITDSTGVITYANPTACSVFGYEREELEGESASILHSKNSPVSFQEIFARAKDWEGDVLAIRKNGERFPLWLRTAYLRDETGGITALITVSRDITEQKEAEEKLQRYALLLEMKVQEKTRGTETLLKTSYALRSTSSWKKGTDIITGGIVEGLGFDRTAVFFVDEHEQILECKGLQNMSEKILRVKIPLTDTRYAVVQCVKERNPVLVKNAATDSRLGAHLEDEAQEFVWVPILFQSRVLGALSADRKKSQKPIESEAVDMLQLYANQIAEFIERTRLVVEPEVEKQMSTPLKYDLEGGEVYLIEEERPEKAYDIFTDLVKHGFKGFGICRMHPQKIREKYALKKTPVMWLSEVESKQLEQIGPQDIPKLLYVVAEFTKRAQPAVVIVEGVEYLIVQNGFKTVLKLLHTLSDYVVMSQSVLLLPINPRSLPQHQYVMLKRAFKTVEDI